MPWPVAALRYPSARLERPPLSGRPRSRSPGPATCASALRAGDATGLAATRAAVFARLLGPRFRFLSDFPPPNREHFDEWIAERYERLWPELFEHEVIDPAVDFLAGLAGKGPVLEFGIGTGRIALPLSQRGVRVHGIELSPAMVARLQAQAGADDITVTTGDFATTTVGESFTLVYLLRNTITNLTTQGEQVECFRNAAAHLEPGGFFVIENYVPALHRLRPDDMTRVFTATPTHVGVEEYDLAAQIAVSRHWWLIDGELKTFSSPHRYVWPAELDLMAHLAGMVLVERWAEWCRAPFASDSQSHISVWRKLG